MFVCVKKKKKKKFYFFCERTRKTEDNFSVATSNVEIGHNNSVANTNVVSGSLHIIKEN